MNSKAAWLIEQLKRDDLPPEVRKRYKNRLKMQNCNSHPKTRGPIHGEANRSHYTRDIWKKISRRRKLANAAKRRNRR